MSLNSSEIDRNFLKNALVFFSIFFNFFNDQRVVNAVNCLLKDSMALDLIIGLLDFLKEIHGTCFSFFNFSI